MAFTDNKEEVAHVIQILRDAQQALRENSSLKLQQLSDQTIHSASIYQHTDFITIAVLMYSLNKVLTQKDRVKNSKWQSFIKKFVEEIDEALLALENDDVEEFSRHLEHGKDLLEDLSPYMGRNIKEVLVHASINKAGKIYEHGISLSRTARLLGISQWELAEYIGQRVTNEQAINETINVKKRAKAILEFLK